MKEYISPKSLIVAFSASDIVTLSVTADEEIKDFIGFGELE